MKVKRIVAGTWRLMTPGVPHGMRNRGKPTAIPGVVVVAVILATVAIGILSSPAAAGGGQGSDLAPNAMSQEGATSPEQQLIDKYAPIIGLKDQEEACDDDGEPFYPVAVDVVFDKDDVFLKHITASSASSDEVVTAAPDATDLYARGDTHYLDLPGDPRDAGCDYEQWFDANRDGYDPMAYAHIVTSGSQLALQYWFFYVFNNFNNTHESDWEMIQILFDVGTAEEALQAEPVSIALAQHGGGETADWDDDKLERDGTHPIVYSAAGSHATQYGDAVYLGWGENGTGFGCDITTGPTTFVPLETVLLPSTQPDPNGEHAWLNFAGRWGERQSGEFNGPTGPSTKTSWKSPFLWQEGLRDSSIEVPLTGTFGPAPTEVFCTLSSFGSSILRAFGESLASLLVAVAAVLAVIVSLVRYSWPIFAEAFRVYRRRWRTFVAIGLWLVPVSLVFNGFQYLIGQYPPGSTVIEVVGRSPGTYYALALLTLLLQQLASLIVVGPMVIEVFDDMNHGRSATFREALIETWKKVPGLVKSVGLVVLVVVPLAATLFALPIAIWLLVRWVFVSQASMLDDVQGKDALHASTVAVRGRWWRVALVGSTLFVFAAAPGVLIGLALLIFGSASVQATNVVSSLLYVVSVPISVLGMTLVYRDRNLTPPMFQLVRRLVGRFRRPEPEEQAAPAAGT